MRNTTPFVVTLLAAALSAACSAPSTEPAAEPATGAPAPSATTPAEPAPAQLPAADPAPADATPAPAASTPAASDFSGKVWKVTQSSAVEAGTTYAFLDGGVLVIDSPNGTPLRGRWDYTDGKLTMTEEGMAYPTDILELDADTFRIRSNNPGEPVEITMALDPSQPLPAAR